MLRDTALQDRLLAEDPMLKPNFNASSKRGWAYERAQRSPDSWWDATLVGPQAAQLVTEGRAALLVSLYDRRFKSPDDFVLHCPSFCDPVATGPALVVALRQMGRRADADRMLAALQAAVRKLEAAGDLLIDTQLTAARLAALESDGNAANRLLREAIARGWKGQETELPDPENDPAFAALRGQPDFQATMRALRAAQHAEALRLAKVDLSGM
jgi:hypothetical protein